MSEELPTMIAVRDEKTHEIICYKVLCPKCHGYTVLDPRNFFDRELLNGQKSYTCFSNECKGSVVLTISFGRAQAHRMPKPDIKKRETPRYQGASAKSFINAAKISKN